MTPPTMSRKIVDRRPAALVEHLHVVEERHLGVVSRARRGPGCGAAGAERARPPARGSGCDAGGAVSASNE